MENVKYFEEKEIESICALHNCLETDVLYLIRDILEKSVNKRMMADNKNMIGCLLSGGLDSSLVTALVVKHYSNPKDLKTFSIGMEGSVDIKYAKIVIF